MKTVYRTGGLLLVAALTASAAPAPDVTKTGTVKDQDRAAFIPYRKYQPLPGKTVGVLVSDVVAKMSHDGRGGPRDAMGFSADGNSYRWIYVPVTGKALINNLRVRIGEKGDRIQNYPLLSLANAATVKQWGITVPYALVEVEVNDKQGAPAEEGFVATKMKRLDGTKDYPLDVTAVLGKMRKRYAAWKADKKTTLDEALTGARKKAIKERKPTGPRETTELFYVTWLPDSKRLCIRFRTTITDGDYKYTPGGRFDRPPFRLPPPPKGAARPGAAVAFPPPPPRFFPRVRYGTSFGIEYGMAFEVDRNGKVVRTLALPAKAFQRVLPTPPAFGPRGPFRLPPPPRLPAKN